MSINLSVVVITKNEQDLILGCLSSIQKIADEIIIVDDLSTDNTVRIARKFTKKIYKNKLLGFASQKNLGISKTKGKWVLILDADERVPRKLAIEIQNITTNNNIHSAFACPRQNYFLGKRTNYGGWQYEIITRLFKKGKAKYAKQEIHEFLIIKGSTGKLKNPILHFSHRCIADNLLKTHQYASLEACYHLKRKSPKVTKWLIIRRMFQHFWYRYIKEKGYKDGMEGFIEAMYQVFSSIFVIQSMLWEKQRKINHKQLYKNLDKKLIKNNFEPT